MWFGLINEIKFWFVRTFKMRNCWMPKGDVSFSWSGELDGGDSTKCKF